MPANSKTFEYDKYSTPTLYQVIAYESEDNTYLIEPTTYNFVGGMWVHCYKKLEIKTFYTGCVPKYEELMEENIRPIFFLEEIDK